MGEKPTVFQPPPAEKRIAAAQAACGHLEKATAVVTDQLIPLVEAAWTSLVGTGMPAAVIGIKARADVLALQARLFELLEATYKAQEDLAKK